MALKGCEMSGRDKSLVNSTVTASSRSMHGGEPGLHVDNVDVYSLSQSQDSSSPVSAVDEDSTCAFPEYSSSSARASPDNDQCHGNWTFHTVDYLCHNNNNNSSNTDNF